jgi:hypothetical protein
VNVDGAPTPATLTAAAVGLGMLALVQGCAVPPPLPFQLVDSRSQVEFGTLFPATRRIEVSIGGSLFSGFFMLASGSAVSESFGGRRGFARETVTTFSSNSARAHLTAPDGRSLSCEFLLESRRALGECRTADGAAFQLIADEK